MPRSAYTSDQLDALAQVFAQAALDELIRDVVCESRSSEQIDENDGDDIDFPPSP
jgi:hypothetical protein